MMGAVLRAGVMASTLALAGCISSLDQVSAPSTVPHAESSWLRISVVTNRVPSDGSRLGYSGERADRASRSDALVLLPPTGPARDVAYVDTPRPAGAGDADRPTVGRKRRVLVYVHGFRVDLDKAVRRFAQVVRDSRTDFEPVLFSWPSRGSILDYYYDRESMDASRDELDRLLRRLTSDSSVDRVTVLAHSMGSWVTMEALRTQALSAAGVSPKLTDVILAAPDLDFNVFRTQMERIGTHPAVTLIVSRDDRSLRFSRVFGGGMDRLGATAIDDARRWDVFCRYRIRVVDATDLPTPGFTNHFKFADAPELIGLLGARLIPGGTPTDGLAGGAVRLRPMHCRGGAMVAGEEGAPIVVHDPGRAAAAVAARP